MLWATPVLRFNLYDAVESSSASHSKEYLRILNSRVLRAILDSHRTLQVTHAENITHDDFDGPNGVNSLFFRWQTEGGWAEIFFEKEAQKAMSTLQKYWNEGIDAYLLAIGVDESAVASRDRSLRPWATVHPNGGWHDLHTHPDHLLSGCYYLSTPPKSGNIIFYDPRGPSPPFDDKYFIHPREGDLVLFPSWLPHMVSPSTTSENDPRVSIAFNAEGDWYQTSNVGSEFSIIA